MTTILDFMTEKHRACDDAFAAAEEAVSLNEWQTATEQWRLFSDELKSHLEMEELVLFPRFEEATGNSNGPTNMMRMEHQQMLALSHQIESALSAEQDEEFLGLSETLMVLMQQHNMKEEQVLYPMADQSIPQAGETIEAMNKI
ncbi:hemerythrin domain-containing protein [Motiliproteus sp. MSK22-1]|uniref:hemerythrin domain-containing protein n=1 Tax=Motiliproteus sp. MSK22-1 TaxID=1897630 RepID=UPI000976D9F6|nr:hemerythrin domain-containing protein [Motiliproteus sp. MSK22-1]OMH29067.1 hemerythrin HHE cation-binding protein [Motiliproteus sp. MSK22-1]